MKHVLTSDAVSARVTVRAINFELDGSVQMIASEKAAQLLRHHPSIEQICLELENDPSRDATHEYVAKGKIDFGGPVLLASVSGKEAAGTLDYLIEQLDHRLRKQHRTKAAPARPKGN